MHLFLRMTVGGLLLCDVFCFASETSAKAGNTSLKQQERIDKNKADWEFLYLDFLGPPLIWNSDKTIVVGAMNVGADAQHMYYWCFKADDIGKMHLFACFSTWSNVDYPQTVALSQDGLRVTMWNRDLWLGEQFFAFAQPWSQWRVWRVNPKYAHKKVLPVQHPFNQVLLLLKEHHKNLEKNKRPKSTWREFYEKDPRFSAFVWSKQDDIFVIESNEDSAFGAHCFYRCFQIKQDGEIELKANFSIQYDFEDCKPFDIVSVNEHGIELALFPSAPNRMFVSRFFAFTKPNCELTLDLQREQPYPPKQWLFMPFFKIQNILILPELQGAPPLMDYANFVKKLADRRATRKTIELTHEQREQKEINRRIWENHYRHFAGGKIVWSQDYNIAVGIQQVPGARCHYYYWCFESDAYGDMQLLTYFSSLSDFAAPRHIVATEEGIDVYFLNGDNTFSMIKHFDFMQPYTKLLINEHVNTETLQEHPIQKILPMLNKHFANQAKNIESLYREAQ